MFKLFYDVHEKHHIGIDSFHYICSVPKIIPTARDDILYYPFV